MKRTPVAKRRNTLANIAWYRAVMEQSSCLNCGESHPATLDWHHRDPELKRFHVPHAVRVGRSRKTILEEMAKCDILCSNCHRIHEWQIRQGIE